VKKLAIIKIDAIGDYVLFRNFLSEIRNSEKYRVAYIHLIGNALWKGLFAEFDLHCVDKVTWLDVRQFSKSRVYRQLVFFRLRFLAFDELICPTFSRRFYYEDDICARIRAKVKIAFQGDTSNASDSQKQRASCIYTTLFITNNMFEFNKNKDFVNWLIGVPPEIISPSFPIVAHKEGYVVLFPGASEAHKRWPVERFRQLAIWLAGQYTLKVYVLGSEHEFELGENIKGDNVENLCGKTTLPKLVELLANAQLLISNDTSAIHIALAVGTKVVGIYKGDHFGRFLPYPSGLTSNLLLVMPLSSLSTSFKSDEISQLQISEVKLEDVITSVEKCLKHLI